MSLAASNELLSLRVDQVGSLLRPQRLKDAFASRGEGRLDDQGLRQAQDEAIREVVARQVAHDLPIIVDGEFRRTSFMESFSVVAGVEEWQAGVKTYHEILKRSDTSDVVTHKGQDPILLNRKRVTQKLKLLRNTLLDDYRFTQSLTDRPVKVTLISADRIQQCYDSAASHAVYADTEEFLRDVVFVERQMIQQLAEADCRYVGIDGPGYTAYVDPDSLAAMRSRGENPQSNLARSIAADNEIIAGFPGIAFGIHICRGNRQSMWHREGHYDAIAEQLFNGLKHQRLLLEYDTERAGSFEPLRFVPKDKIAVLGLITTKVARVESIDELRRRIDDAARYLPIEQLALSPQCGFASSLRGNLLTEDEQFRKLDAMLETATKVWG
ncbi:MAG TPA: 5-methyltetrahydropteroyltriglutamate--homocysteine S-methyltransferase [Candidatus Binatia bacterium]|nr:5-methyltetrahydropteroyltriglutamate--homocysteine S-methyltransferase [Candidatus Binatia bacterium]